MNTAQAAGGKPPFTATGEPLAPSFEAKPFWWILENSATRFPDRLAIVYNDYKLTYRDFWTLTQKMAAGLQKLGIQPGDRIGVCMPNHPATMLAFFGVLRAGATVVMMGPLYAEPTLAGQARDAGMKAIITLDTPDLETKMRRVTAAASVPHLIAARHDVSDMIKAGANSSANSSANTSANAAPGSLASLLDNPPSPALVPCDPKKDIAALQYSGGTTGEPKGVMLTHANLHVALQQFVQALPMIGFGTETILAVGPFFHIAGLNGSMNPAVHWAATQVIVERFDLNAADEIIRKHEISYVCGVPTLFFALADAAAKNNSSWPSLKATLSGGAPLPEAVKNRFEKQAGCQLFHAYGLSECAPPVSIPAAGKDTPAPSCGIPVAGTEVQIRSQEDPTIVLPQGEVGEVCVRGPQVMAGYWNRPEQTKAAFVDGFVRTGDLGRFDDQGRLYIVDRLKDIIICSGFNVYPVRVEEAMFQHPAIAEAIVLGIPDEYRGETVKAFVKLREGHDDLKLEELQEFLKPYLSSVEMPKLLEIRETLPRSEVGKLSRRKLRDEIDQ